MRADTSLAGLRLAVVASSEIASDGRVRRYLEAAADAGAEVLALGLAETGTIDHPRIRLVPVGEKYRGDSPRSYVSRYWQFFRAAQDEVRRFRPDVIHAHNMPDFLVASGLPRFRTPVLLDVHDIMSDVYSEKRMSLRGWKRAGLAACLRLEQLASWNVASEIQTVHEPYAARIRQLGARRPRVTVGLNVPDPALFAPAPYAAGPRCRFLMAGTVTARSGAMNLLRAFEPLDREGHSSLAIIGPGDDWPAVFETARDLGLQNVELRPERAPLSEIAGEVGASDVVVVPYRLGAHTRWALPQKLTEAAAVGRAAVAPSSTVIRHYFGHDEVEFWNGSDEASLTHAMRRLALDPRRRELLAGSIGRFRDEHPWSRYRDSYRRTLERLAAA